MEPILEIKDLYKSFGSKKVLQGINLTVYAGQIIGYIGTNGAGKSTTVKMILGLLQADAGEIYLYGQEISVENVDYKKRIGYVPENAELYDTLTAAEYLGFVGELYGLSESFVAEKALKLMTILGLEEVYHTRLSAFSKGMRQKVLIISSLLHNPDVLFWDEPLSGLDANSVLVIKEILNELKKQGKTIFYSSHIMDIVEKLSDRILILNEGKIIADGTFAEISSIKNEAEEDSGHSDDTLEALFNQLTGFNEHGTLAQEFVAAMIGGVDCVESTE